MEIKISRLSVDLPEKDHILIKMHALSKGMTLKQYVLEALALMVLEDEKKGIGK